MAKKSELPQRVTPQFLQKPDYLADQPIQGTEAMQEFRIVQRIKTVQKSSGPEYLNSYRAGDIIVMPNMTLLASIGDGGGMIDQGLPFKFVPLFFYPEWLQVNPLCLKGQEPMIRYRTNNPADPIVMKCKTKELRYEQHPTLKSDDEKKMIRNVQALNYIITPYEHELAGEPLLLTFQKGEYFTGGRFVNLVNARKASLFNCVFQGQAKFRAARVAGAGDWYGIEVTNPDDGRPWPSKEECAKFLELHTDLKTHFEAGLLKTPDDDEIQTADADGGEAGKTDAKY